MANLSDYIGDVQRAEKPEPNAVERGVNLLDVAAKSAVYSAVQQPMDGISQLVGLKAPKLIEEGKQYEFNTPEWYASTIGHGAGFMVPFVATSKLTGLTGMKAGVGKAMFDGAVTGFTMTPTKDGESALGTRSLAAFSSSVMFGTQHLLAGQMASRLVGAAESAPILTRLGVNTGSGVGAGLVSLEATSLIQGHGFVTDKQVLVENAVAAAATGFALDAFNIATTRKAGSGERLQQESKSGDGSAQAPAQRLDLEPALKSEPVLRSEPVLKSEPVLTSEPAWKAAEITDGTIGGGVLKPEAYKQISEWTNPQDGFVGAKQYKTESGKTFWQIPDGRIYYEDGAAENPVFRTWSPFGSGDPATFLGPEGQMGRQIWTRHEPEGFFYNQEGVPHKRELFNLYEDMNVSDRPDLPHELAHKLALSVPMNLEPQTFSFARIVHTTDGAMFEPAEINIRVPKAGNPPNGLTLTDYINNWTTEQTVPARRYQILNADQTHATSVVVPESYAAKLDQVRNLREIATQDPARSPELREDILRARRDLFLSGYADRLLPEHWGQFIDILPNAKTISELQLVETPDPEGATIADTALETGRVRFYAENNGVQQHVRRTLIHEWTHTTERTQKSLRSAYDSAAKIEEFSGREYARTNTHEDWAVHFAEMLMDPNPELFMTLAHKAPIRTALLGEALRRELNASPEHQSINKQELEARLQYIEQNVLPQAKEQVMNGIRSNDLRKVSDATQLVDRLSRSEIPGDKQLAERLVDKEVLARGVDNGFNALNGDFNSYLAARALQRMELLRQVDPEAASSRLERATEVTARMRTRMTHLLSSKEPSVVDTALTTGEHLVRGMADSEVFRRTFPFDSVAEVAISHPDAALASRAFNLLRETFPTNRVNELALQMIKGKSTGRGAAAEYALSVNDTKFLGEATTELSRQVLTGDGAALTPEALATFNKVLDANVADIVSGKNTNMENALRTLARGRLLQDIVMSRFDLVDAPMQARTQRITQLEQTVRAMIEAKRNGTEADKKELERALSLMPQGMMDPPENSSGIILL